MTDNKTPLILPARIRKSISPGLLCVSQCACPERTSPTARLRRHGLSTSASADPSKKSSRSESVRLGRGCRPHARRYRIKRIMNPRLNLACVPMTRSAVATGAFAASPAQPAARQWSASRAASAPLAARRRLLLMRLHAIGVCVRQCGRACRRECVCVCVYGGGMRACVGGMREYMHVGAGLGWDGMGWVGVGWGGVG